MEQLKWNSDIMAVDNSIIDEQHQVLLNIINKITTAIESNSCKNTLEDIIDEILEYTQFHFSTEEEILEESNYKEVEKHKEGHIDFIKNFQNIKNEFKECEELQFEKMAESIYSYLSNWLINHILKTDKKITIYLKTS